MNRRILGRLVAIVLLAAAAWYVGDALAGNLSRLRTEVEAPGPLFWSGGTLVLALMLVYPLLWLLILRGVGVPLRVAPAYAIWWLTNLGKYIPGKAWMVLGRVYLAREHGKGRLLESFAWEFVINCSSSLIAGLLLFWGPGGHRALWPLVAAAALLSLVPLARPDLVQKVMQAPLAWIGRGTWEGGVRMRRGPYVAALALATLGWLAWGVAHTWMLAGIGLDAPYWAVTGAYSLAWVLGYVVLVLPAGLGVREGVLQFLMAPFLVTGGAALFALVSRTVIVLAEAVAGLVGLLMWRRLSVPPPSVPAASADAGDTPGTLRGGQG